MNTKIRTILLSLLALLALAGLYCALVLPLNGSLVHKLALRAEVRRYVDERYGGDLTVEKAIYDFKSGTYLCQVRSQTSQDTHFTVYESKDGALLDSFFSDVVQRENTVWRLTRELDRELVEKFLPRFPMNCVDYRCSFDQKVLDAGTAAIEGRFTLDMPLAPDNPPLPLELALWVECEAPSWEALAEAFRAAKGTVQELGWQISFYCVTLHTPMPDQGGKPINTATWYTGSRIPGAWIDRDDLAAILEAAAEAQ